MTLGIVIPTYKRIDGSTPFYLSRALTSIKNQTYKDYKVFLIGDDYEDDKEFTQLATSIIDGDKIYYENLPVAVERSKYKSGKILWATGGINANNYGINKCLSEGIIYICHLDHDDYWEPNHLAEIAANVDEGYIIISTKAVHHNGNVIPENVTHPYYPKSSHLAHSSVCINFKKCPLRYRDLYAEENKIYASDADFWNRLNSFMLNNGEKGKLIDKITCHHDRENE